MNKCKPTFKVKPTAKLLQLLAWLILLGCQNSETTLSSSPRPMQDSIENKHPYVGNLYGLELRANAHRIVMSNNCQNNALPFKDCVNSLFVYPADLDQLPARPIGLRLPSIAKIYSDVPSPSPSATFDLRTQSLALADHSLVAVGNQTLSLHEGARTTHYASNRVYLCPDIRDLAHCEFTPVRPNGGVDADEVFANKVVLSPNGQHLVASVEQTSIPNQIDLVAFSVSAGEATQVDRKNTLLIDNVQAIAFDAQRDALCHHSKDLNEITCYETFNSTWFNKPYTHISLELSTNATATTQVKNLIIKQDTLMVHYQVQDAGITQDQLKVFRYSDSKWKFEVNVPLDDLAGINYRLDFDWATDVDAGDSRLLVRIHEIGQPETYFEIFRRNSGGHDWIRITEDYQALQFTDFFATNAEKNTVHVQYRDRTLRALTGNTKATDPTWSDVILSFVRSIN